jgi:hypothetical protein
MHNITTNGAAQSDNTISAELTVDYFPPYASLQRKYRVSLAINIILLIIIFPAFLIGFAMMEGRNCSHNDSTRTPINNTDFGFAGVPPFVGRDISALPPRFCVSGFSKGELDAMFHDTNEKYDKRGRIWNAPCEYVQIIDYPNGIKAEYDFVVTD